MRADTFRWTAAILLSVLGHAYFFLEGGGSLLAGPTSPVPIQEKVTRVRFRTAMSAALASEKRAAEPRKVAVDGEKRKAVSPKPASVKPDKPAKPDKTETPQTQTDVAAAPQNQDAVAVPGPSASAVDDAASEQALIAARMRYARILASHIEHYKYYPDSARRRGIAGGVRVGFLVTADGKAAALECDQGPGILNAAACDAVRRAMPLPQPPAEMALPMPVSFVMQFALN